MFFNFIAVLASFLFLNLDYVSGEAETVTGPITFLWPEQRAWYAAWQTNSPCGTNSGTVGNRTDFPLGMASLEILL